MTWLNIISSSSLGLFILMKQTEGRALRNGNDEEQSLPLLTESTGLEHLEPGSIIHVEPTNTDKHTQVDAGVIGRDVHPDSETIIDVINYEQDFTDIIDTIIKNAEGIDIDEEDEEFDAIVGLYGSKWHLFSRWMKCKVLHKVLALPKFHGQFDEIYGLVCGAGDPTTTTQATVTFSSSTTQGSTTATRLTSTEATSTGISTSTGSTDVTSSTSSSGGTSSTSSGSTSTTTVEGTVFTADFSIQVSIESVPERRLFVHKKESEGMIQELKGRKLQDPLNGWSTAAVNALAVTIIAKLRSELEPELTVNGVRVTGITDIGGNLVITFESDIFVPCSGCDADAVAAAQRAAASQAAAAISDSITATPSFADAFETNLAGCSDCGADGCASVVAALDTATVADCGQYMSQCTGLTDTTSCTTAGTSCLQSTFGCNNYFYCGYTDGGGGDDCGDGCGGDYGK